jgi:hypothetical protein
MGAPQWRKLRREEEVWHFEQLIKLASIKNMGRYSKKENEQRNTRKDKEQQ